MNLEHAQRWALLECVIGAENGPNGEGTYQWLLSTQGLRSPVEQKASDEP